MPRRLRLVEEGVPLRDYRVGVLFGVAIRGEGLEPLREALNAPVFTLYPGRKSSPLSAPPGARIVEAADAEQALAGLVLPPWRAGMVPRVLLADAGAGDAHIQTRHDVPRDRQCWQFSPRQVAVHSLNQRQS